MRKIVYLAFILVCFSFYSKAQSVDSVFATKINCFDSIGYITVHCSYCDVTPNISYQWYDTTGTGMFLNVLSTNQDYVDTVCGVYTLIVLENNIPFDTVSRFIGCPLTIGNGYVTPACVGDSGTLKRPAFGGTVFDPDSSVVLNDTLNGDEYYLYTWWYSADDSVAMVNSAPILADDSLASDLLGPAGWYWTEIEDAVGCKDSIIRKFNDPDSLLFNAILLDNIACYGDATNLELQVKGGTKIDSAGLGYFYYITQNTDTDTISYADLLLGQHPNFTATFTDTLFWRPDTVSIVLYASTDSFHVIVADSMGCILDTTIFISQPDSIVSYIIEPINTLVCSYESALISLDTITGGTSPYTFYWNNDITLTDSSIYVNGGVNKIYIVDANGCLDSTNAVNISSAQDFILTDSINDIACYGDSAGEIFLQITGGAHPLSYTWEKDGIPFTGVPSDTIIQDLVAGSYQLIIKDANQCVDTSIFILSENPEIILGNSVSSISCSFSTDGNIQLNISGGISPYTYLWGNGSTLDSIVGLQAGTYNVTVTDSLNCSVQNSFVIQSPDTLSISFANYTDSLSCYGELTTVDVVIDGGVGPFSILWYDGDTTIQRILGAGSYSCEVTDVNGCSDTAILTITEPDSLEVTLTFNYFPCDSSGSNASISVSGGVEPISIVWSTGETTFSIDSLWGTTYWVIVTDSCGNTDSTGLELSSNLVTILNYDSLTHIGSVDAFAYSTGGPFSYVWTDVLDTIISTDSVTSNLCEGTYFVTTTDNTSNCSVTDSLDVPPYYLPAQLPGSIMDTSTTRIFSNDSLWGASSYAFLWSDSSTSRQANLCPGSHWVVVTDDIGCVVKADFDIATDFDEELIIDISTTTVLHDDSLWGSAPYKYLWDNGDTAQHADICPGPHWVEVTDTFGCEVRYEFEISKIEITLEPAEPILACELVTLDFELKASAEGGTEDGGDDYEYQWSGGSTGETIDFFLNPGNHSVMVMDHNGCTEDTAFTIAVMTEECIPNVFTPNGDNINDTWNLENTFLFEDSEVLIYGRFGKQLFQSIGYPENWDGTNKKGNDVPAGVYFYFIELGHGFEPIKGTVTILK